MSPVGQSGTPWLREYWLQRNLTVLAPTSAALYGPVWGELRETWREKVAAMANPISEKATNLAADLGGILIFLLVLFLVIHMGAAFIAYLWSPSWLCEFKASIGENIAVTMGIPSPAVGAYSVVALLPLLYEMIHRAIVQQ